MQKGKNLEEIFLEARIKVDQADYPMISTLAGKLTQDKLYDLLTPYLYYNWGPYHKLDDMYEVSTIESKSCNLEKKYSKLTIWAKQMAKINGEDKLSALDILLDSSNENDFFIPKKDKKIFTELSTPSPDICMMYIPLHKF